MRKQNEVAKTIIQEQTIYFLLEGTAGEGGTPSGKMITDSDNEAFVYLLEKEDGYTYIHFPKDVWPAMAEVLTEGKRPILKAGDAETELTGFKEELEMLIFNIEGNDNYGEEFTTAVESQFESVLQGAE